MGDLNKIRIYPIGNNSIVLSDPNTIELEPDISTPNGFIPSNYIGGSDVKASLETAKPTAGPLGGNATKSPLGVNG
jgi:hypothetical protein